MISVKLILDREYNLKLNRGTLYSHCLRDQLSPITLVLDRPRTYGLIGPAPSPTSNSDLESGFKPDSQSAPAQTEKESEERPFFTYFYETSPHSPSTMYISYISHSNSKVKVPLSVIRQAMLHENCSIGEIWGEAGNIYEGQEGVSEKEDNVPCLAVYGGLDVDEVDWQFNDKYVAC
jgi:hypothetical protein